MLPTTVPASMANLPGRVICDPEWAADELKRQSRSHAERLAQMAAYRKRAASVQRPRRSAAEVKALRAEVKALRARQVTYQAIAAKLEISMARAWELAR